MRSAGANTASGEAPGAVWLEKARQLGPVLTAAAAEIEARRELPEPIVAALASCLAISSMTGT